MTDADEDKIKKLGDEATTKTFLDDPFTVTQYIGRDTNGGKMLLSRLQAGESDAYDEYQVILEKAHGHKTGWGLSPDPDNIQLCEDPFTRDQMRVTFSDIAGARNAKREMMIGFVYPATFPGLFTKTSSGVLLYGPPGTGKTLLAKAAVRELDNVAFYAPSPADLKGKYIGESEKNIRRVFVCASKDRPAIYNRSILFMDEIESIAGVRGDSEGMNASVTALLQAMDGISSDDTVSVLAATNYPNKLDTAVLRRFSAQIFVDLPTFEARLYLIVRSLAKAFNSMGMRDMKDLNLEVVSPETTWAGKKYGRPSRPRKLKPIALNWMWHCNCDFMTQLSNYGTEHQPESPVSLSNCSVRDLRRLITRRDIIDLTSMTGPSNNKATKDLIATRTHAYEFSSRARTEYGFSGSDIDKLMDTIIRTAATRALNQRVATVEISEADKHIAIPGDRALSMGRAGYTVTKEQAFALGAGVREFVMAFDLTLFDFCVGLADFRPTIDSEEYKRIVHYSQGKL